MQESCLEKNPNVGCVYELGKMKVFYRQRIPGSICARRETADKEILTTSMDDERKFMEYITSSASSGEHLPK